jgi:hypothetical protein
MATTTNYSWSTPDDTALVKDGAAAIRSLGTAIDTTVFTNAGAAINKTIIDAAGDLIYGTAADTAARLAIGTANQQLRVNSGATAPEWFTPSGASGMTLISTTTLTGGSVLLSSIPQTYKDLQIIIRNFKPATDNIQIRMQFNNDSNAGRHRSLINDFGLTNGTFNVNYSEVTERSDNSVAPGLTRIDIFDYTNATTWKIGQTLSFTANQTTTTNFNFFNYKFIYNQTGAITDLNFFPESGNFTSGTILLYGVA